MQLPQYSQLLKIYKETTTKQLQRPDKWEENKKETLSSEQMRISSETKRQGRKWR